MKYWSPIRTADLKNWPDAELRRFHKSSSNKAYIGVGLMGAGGLALAAGFLSVVFPVIPVTAVIVLGGGMIITGMRLQSKNFDGMMACTSERMRRTPDALEPAALQAPAAAAAPVFNGVAATVLQSSMKPMKTIKISPKTIMIRRTINAG